MKKWLVCLLLLASSAFAANNPAPFPLLNSSGAGIDNENQIIQDVNSLGYFVGSGGGSGGSGTVSAGTTGQYAYYAANGTTVVGTSSPTGATVTLSGGSTGFSFSPSSFNALFTGGSGGGGGGLSTVNQITSGSSNTLSSLTAPRITQAWFSSTASAKTEAIPPCTSGVAGYDVTIKDEYGSSATYPITITSSSSTIENASSYTINGAYQAITLECDGGTNWMGI